MLQTTMPLPPSQPSAQVPGVGQGPLEPPASVELLKRASRFHVPAETPSPAVGAASKAVFSSGLCQFRARVRGATGVPVQGERSALLVRPLGCTTSRSLCPRTCHGVSRARCPFAFQPDSRLTCICNCAPLSALHAIASLAPCSVCTPLSCPSVACAATCGSWLSKREPLPTCGSSRTDRARASSHHGMGHARGGGERSASRHLLLAALRLVARVT